MILSRLINLVEEALSPVVNIERIYCWSDSITALYWIKGVEKDWKVFIDNRVQEIRKHTDSGSWYHCPGIQNPADIPSRGVTPKRLADCSHWWTGPE